MKNYPIEKYEFEIRQHPIYLGVETIAHSTYAGQPVTGKAICHADDEYNEQFGMELAAARCAAKIAHKRNARATAKVLEAGEKVKQARQELDNMFLYKRDAMEEVEACDAKIAELLAR